MKARDLLREKREQILQMAAKNGARNVRVFGSVVRGEADEASDIDFLVEMEPGRSLFDLGGLQADLEEFLGCRVDVVTEKGLNPRTADECLTRPLKYEGPARASARAAPGAIATRQGLNINSRGWNPGWNPRTKMPREHPNPGGVEHGSDRSRSPGVNIEAAQFQPTPRSITVLFSEQRTATPP